MEENKARKSCKVASKGGRFETIFKRDSEFQKLKQEIFFLMKSVTTKLFFEFFCRVIKK